MVLEVLRLRESSQWQFLLRLIFSDLHPPDSAACLAHQEDRENYLAPIYIEISLAFLRSQLGRSPKQATHHLITPKHLSIVTLKTPIYGEDAVFLDYLDSSIRKS